MPDFSLALPDEICLELGARARARRVMLNVSVDEMAERIGMSSRALGNFERTGKCTLSTFVRILEALNALPDLQPVLITQTQTIESMRAQAATATRQRAYRTTARRK
jgi:transcriptional regulator with XRE-family HTH domain